MPALERGWARAGTGRDRFQLSGPMFVVTGANEEEMEAAIHALYLHERESLIEFLLSWMGDVLRHHRDSLTN